MVRAGVRQRQPFVKIEPGVITAKLPLEATFAPVKGLVVNVTGNGNVIGGYAIIRNDCRYRWCQA